MGTQELKVPEKKLPAATQEHSASPFFVEAEMLFEKLANISKQVAAQAYDNFRVRGGQFGRELEDWVNAESKVLRFTPLEVTEKNGAINVTAAVPGFRPDDIEISVDGNTLMISGEAKTMEHAQDEDVFYSDFYSDRFFRRIPLPVNVDVDHATANLKHARSPGTEIF